MTLSYRGNAKQNIRDTIDWRSVNIMSTDVMSKKRVYP